MRIAIGGAASAAVLGAALAFTPLTTYDSPMPVAVCEHGRCERLAAALMPDTSVTAPQDGPHQAGVSAFDAASQVTAPMGEVMIPAIPMPAAERSAVAQEPAAAPRTYYPRQGSSASSGASSPSAGGSSASSSGAAPASGSGSSAASGSGSGASATSGSGSGGGAAAGSGSGGDAASGSGAAAPAADSTSGGISDIGALAAGGGSGSSSGTSTGNPVEDAATAAGTSMGSSLGAAVAPALAATAGVQTAQTGVNVLFSAVNGVIGVAQGVVGIGASGAATVITLNVAYEQAQKSGFLGAIQGAINNSPLGWIGHPITGPTSTASGGTAQAATASPLAGMVLGVTAAPLVAGAALGTVAAGLPRVEGPKLPQIQGPQLPQVTANNLHAPTVYAPTIHPPTLNGPTIHGPRLCTPTIWFIGSTCLPN